MDEMPKKKKKAPACIPRAAPKGVRASTDTTGKPSAQGGAARFILIQERDVSARSASGKRKASRAQPSVQWRRPLDSLRRNEKQAEEERRVFEIFSALDPACASGGAMADQPDDEFPDVVVYKGDGRQIAYELGEWLQPSQMAASMRLLQQEHAIGAALRAHKA